MYYLHGSDPHSDELVAAIHDLAVEAAESDTWMELTDDNADDLMCQEDFSEWAGREEDGWRETAHFAVKYRKRLRRLIEDIDDTTLENEDPIAFDRDWLLPAEYEFIQAWMQASGAYEYWQENIAA